MMTYMLSFLDRQVINILAEPIKADLKLADWQLGIMTGLSFALLYTVLGIPIARWAERGHRPFIIATAVMTWSAFTALCGVTHNFIQLLMARAGVGVGEAGGTPPALSLISDYVAPEKRASAIGFYFSGGALGALLGLGLGGLAADLVGWRATFLLIGAPGVLVAAVIALTLREPRGAAARRQARSEKRPGRLMSDLRALARNPTYMLVVIAATARAVDTYSAQTFYGSFFLRNHGDALERLATPLGLKPLGLLGLALGAALGLASFLGAMTGGYLTDHAVRRNKKAFATIPAVASLLAVPCAISAYLANSIVLSLGLLAVANFIAFMATAPSFASVQGLASPQSRATATAVMLFVISLIGLGVGPVAAGLLSDLLGSVFGLGSGEGVRWALICSAGFGCLAAGASWAARKTMSRDLVS